jgi:hypothetical protein
MDAHRELRRTLGQKMDAELIELLRKHDTEEWRPEVFLIAEHILRRRGIDVRAALGPPAAAPSPEPKTRKRRRGRRP